MNVVRPSGVLYTAVFVILQLRLPVVESKVRSMNKRQERIQTRESIRQRIRA